MISDKSEIGFDLRIEHLIALAVILFGNEPQRSTA